MKHKVTFDRRAWGLLRKSLKKSTSSIEFWKDFYTFTLLRAGLTSQELKFFKDVGKRLNPRAFVVTGGFENKLRNLFRKNLKMGYDGYHTSSLNFGPGNMAPESLTDNDILIMGDYYE